MRLPLALCALLASVTAAQAAKPAAKLSALVATYYDGLWKASPVTATQAGLHAWDSQLDDVSAAAHAREAARLKSIVIALQALNGVALSLHDRDDRDVVAAHIDGSLLEEITVQQWRHNPATYVDLLTTAIYSLIERDFAPLSARMASVIAREALVPAMLAEAKKNLTNMPPVFIDIALENLDGAVGFLTNDVPVAFTAVKESSLRARLAQSTKAALAACADYRAFLIAQKPAAHGSFVLGRTAMQRLLASDMVTVPVERVLAAGRAQLAKDHATFLATEKLIDPKDPAGALKMIEADHPDAAHLIPTARAALPSLRAFIEAHHIVDLPSPMMPTVGETPPFARALIFGELDPPGPLEAHATQAYFFITPPDPKSSAAAQSTFLEYWNKPVLQNLAVHEALPGHFTQYLYLHANPTWSIVRKMAQSYTATEGWAHYSEQMMLDEGLGAGDPKLRLAQLQDALLRDCRLIAAIGMHTQGMSLAQATDMMQTQCFQPPDVAPKEARRGTSDPGYYSYTLGKLEILKLRADVQAAEGKSFTLAHFHDRFLSAGLVPIAVIRREILGKDAPAL
jgi:hypothetical protein